MKWEEVFDKSFNIRGTLNEVIVFLPGTYTGSHISYVWTTLEEIERGVDLLSLPVHHYGLYGAEIHKPGAIFQDYQYLVKMSQEELVCRKIQIMEERWKKFQAAKKGVAKQPRKLRGNTATILSLDEPIAYDFTF